MSEYSLLDYPPIQPVPTTWFVGYVPWHFFENRPTTPTEYQELLDGIRPGDGTRVEIQMRSGRFKATRFAVVAQGAVLNKDLDFEHEPMPSNRTEEFLERTRFNSVEEATTAFTQFFEKILKEKKKP